MIGPALRLRKLIMMICFMFFANISSDPSNYLDINDKAIIIIDALNKRVFLLLFDINL
jgi:hypothetical protein